MATSSTRFRNAFLISFLFLIVLLAMGAPTFAQDCFKPRVYPVDDAWKNPDFEIFRAELRKAIQHKDVDFLLRHTAENISFSFGDEDYLEAFIRTWDLKENPSESRIWKELEEVLRLGGTFQDDQLRSFTAPYLFTTFDPDYDAFEYAAITGTQVRMRSGPGLNFPVSATLDYEIVKYAGWEESREETIGGETHAWVKVITHDNITGYIFGKYVRSQIDFRANFKLIDGIWTMTYFIAGD